MNVSDTHSRRVDVAVIVPVYHGRPFLAELCQRLVAVLTANFSSFQIVLVDDDDPSDAWSCIENLSKADPRIAGLRMSRNFGQHAAISAGIDLANANWYVVMDCDLQDPPEYISSLYREAVQQGYDIVIARRKAFVDKTYRQVASRIFNYTLRHLSDLDISADHGNYRIFSHQVAEAYRQMQEQARLFPALMARLGFRVGKVTTPRAPRPDGMSSYSMGKLLRLAYEIIIANSEKPLMLGVLASVIFGVATVGTALYVIIKKMFFGIPVDGWTSIVVIVCIIGSFQLFLTSIIGLYVGRTFNEAKARPHYFVRNRINI